MTETRKNNIKDGSRSEEGDIYWTEKIYGVHEEDRLDKTG